MNNNFWLNLKKNNKREIKDYLVNFLGNPQEELEINLLEEILKKIYSYYLSEGKNNYNVYSCEGIVKEIVKREFKEGKNKGKKYFLLVLENGEKIHAQEDNISHEKWKKIINLEILGKKIVFEYKKWIVNKQLLDFKITLK